MPTILYVVIPRAMSEAAADRRFGDRIDRLMRAKKLGTVSGGSVDAEDSYVGIAVEATDARQALPVLQAKLRALKAPRGTVIEESQGPVPASVLGGKPTAVHPVW